jgi:hypothetical protein
MPLGWAVMKTASVFTIFTYVSGTGRGRLCHIVVNFICSRFTVRISSASHELTATGQFSVESDELECF